MNLFKKIDYSRMLRETLRAYHSVNAAGQLSIMYKFCLCCLYPLQAPFNAFDNWRIRTLLIAQCKWQMGQLKNVLNMLYDPTLKRVYITQAQPIYVFAPNIDEAESTVYAPNIDEGESIVYAPNIDDPTLYSDQVTIFIPASIYASPTLMSQLVSDIEQIKFAGTLYLIQPI
jgi:hypothetical protein